MTFSIFNIPVNITPGFWIFLIYFTDFYREPTFESLIWGVILFVSLLIHELGHALTAVFFGAKSSITMKEFGGLASYTTWGITPKQNFWIILNGPLFQALLMAHCYFLLESGIFEALPYSLTLSYIHYFVYITLYLNTVWLLFNLIPVEPLDGGQLARYFLDWAFGSAGEKISVFIGTLAIVGFGSYYVIEEMYFFAGFLFFYGIMGYFPRVQSYFKRA